MTDLPLFDLFDDVDRTCPHCSGDASEPDHTAHCCGQQGQVEAEEPQEPAIVVVTFPVVRETSVQAFFDEVNSGAIRKQQCQRWTALNALGVSTANEVSHAMAPGDQFVYRTMYARLAELRDLGFVRETAARPCRVTGRMCVTWTVVLESEYAGPATINRCPTCNQPVSRDVPVLASTK